MKMKKLKAFLKWLFTPDPETYNSYNCRYLGWYPMM